MKVAAPRKYYYSDIHPKQFALWIFLGTIIMAFAGLTSAFIVRKGAGDWTMYKIPSVFFVSTLIILLSSVSLQWAYHSYKKENYTKHRTAILTTILLGLVFVALQYIGWKQLSNTGIRLQGNPSGAFFYVISGFHALHVAGGLVILFVFLIKSFTFKEPVKRLLEEVNPERMIGHKLMLTYWHFVGILWIYLYGFLYIFSL